MVDQHALQLGLLPGLTVRTLEELSSRFGSLQDITGASSVALREAGLSPKALDALTTADPQRLELCLQWAATPGQQIITWQDDCYPQLLRQTASPPPLLFIKGDADLLSMPQLAIVGSRNATPGGLNTASAFAFHLARAGFCITSGLAQGIDAAAHDAALKGAGSTLAVLGTGPDIIYPRNHAQLAERIAATGALISEFPPGTPPRRSQFPQRNRIISGLSVGTLVVEAGLRSGALITARMAGEQGREVFAVPGSIHNPVARGCHQLIKAGAKLAETAEDILEELGAIVAGIAAEIKQNAEPVGSAEAPEINQEHQELLDFMGWDPVHIDTLVNRSGLTAEEVSSILLILALKGRVEPLSGGRYIQREEGQPDERNRS